MIWPGPHPLSGREAPLTLGHDLPRVLAMVAAGALDPAAVVDHPVPLAAAGAELERLAADHGGTIKGMVQIR